MGKILPVVRTSVLGQEIRRYRHNRAEHLPMTGIFKDGCTRVCVELNDTLKDWVFYNLYNTVSGFRTLEEIAELCEITTQQANGAVTALFNDGLLERERIPTHRARALRRRHEYDLKKDIEIIIAELHMVKNEPDMWRRFRSDSVWPRTDISESLKEELEFNEAVKALLKTEEFQALIKLVK